MWRAPWLVVVVACATAPAPQAHPAPPLPPTQTTEGSDSTPPDGAVPARREAAPQVKWPTASWDASCGVCSESIVEPTCLRCGGAWDAGLAGVGDCACPTPDAGKPCRDERDCCGGCALPWDEAIQHGGVRCNYDFCIGPGADVGLPWGTCATHQRTFGCRGWFERITTPWGPMRRTKWICVD